MHPTAAHRFQKFSFSASEEQFAKAVNPYFYCFLQNKIADYAHAVIEHQYEGDLQASLIRHERLKAQVEVLEELLQELIPPTEEVPPEATPI